MNKKIIEKTVISYNEDGIQYSRKIEYDGTRDFYFYSEKFYIDEFFVRYF